MTLAPAVRTRIESILAEFPVVLFMKGTRDAPRCGFSAATVGVLNELLPDYASVDVLADAEPGLALHLAIDARFQAQFHLAEADENAIRSDAKGIALFMDLASAKRAQGIRIDWVETSQGAGLAIDNPNAPATVKSLSV